ncbi:uncharacterized protein [Ambystoma mexicanum]|uniref:uncharacterized protein n=1 Tax=Ambystoma mexicanum TaxID=8296 RepID=UPI0037E9734A
MKVLFFFIESGTPLLSECSSNDSYLGLYGTHQPWACSPPDTMYTCCCEYNYKASTLRTSGYGNISTLSPNNPALNPSSSNGNGVPSGGGAGATSAASPTSNPSSSNSNGVPSGGGAGATTAASPTSNPSSSNSNGVPSGGGAGTSSVASPTSNPSSSNSNGVPSGGGAGTSSVASPASTHTSHHSSPLNNASTGATVASRPAANYSTGPVYLVKKNLSWWDALAHCRSNHSDLASIATPQVQKAAAEIARSAEGEGVWIGLRRHRVWGNLYWIDKNHSQMYTNWGDGEPSDPSSELCVLMTRDAAKNFTWADHCCHVRLNFLCSTDGASTNGG